MRTLWLKRKSLSPKKKIWRRSWRGLPPVVLDEEGLTEEVAESRQNVKLRDRQRYYYCLQAFQGSDENKLPMQQMVLEYLEHALTERLAAVEQAYRLSKDERNR